MKRPLLWVGIAFFCGTLCALSFSVRYGLRLTFAGVLFSFLWPRKDAFSLGRGLLFSFCFLAGILCTNQYLEKEENAAAWLLSRQQLTGSVSFVGEGSFRLRIRAPQGGSFYCQVFWDGEAKPEPGMELTVRGEVQELSAATNPGQFHWKSYGRNHGILAQCNADSITIHKNPSLMFAWSNRLGQWICMRAEELFSKDTAGIVVAMLTGNKQGLPEDFYEDLCELGGSHILAVSGTHVSILSGIVLLLFCRLLGRRYAYAVGFVLLFFFGFLTGFPVSCVRALGAYMLAATGRLLGRRADPLTSLSVILIFCVLLRPVQLLDFGSQLSFGAVFVLTGVLPCFQKTEEKKKPHFLRRLLNVAKSSFLLQLCLLPLLLYRNYRFSPYCVFINCVLLLGATAFFLLCIALFVLSVFFPNAAAFLALSAEFLVLLVRMLCRFLLQCPFSVVVTGRPEFWGVLLFYLCFAAIAFRCRKSALSPAHVGILILSIGLLFHCQREKELVFLDVGQGDCAVILYETTACVIDCGSSSKKDVGTDILLPFLRRYGHAEIDFAVLSHLDTDHTSGLAQILQEGIFVREILLLDYQDGSAEKWLEENCYSGVWQVPRAGAAYAVKELAFYVVFPYEQPETTQNEASLTVLLQAGKSRVLFPGDLNAQLLLEVAKETGPIDLLKVPHHGSRFSADEEAISLLGPASAVISCGKDNRYGHPHAETLAVYEKLGVSIYRTDTGGCYFYPLKEDGDR